MNLPRHSRLSRLVLAKTGKGGNPEEMDSGSAAGMTRKFFVYLRKLKKLFHGYYCLLSVLHSFCFLFSNCSQPPLCPFGSVQGRVKRSNLLVHETRLPHSPAAAGSLAMTDCEQLPRFLFTVYCLLFIIFV